MSNHEREGPRSPGEDAPLKRAWKQASDEQPPPELDAAIIAAARKSVQDCGAGVTAIHTEPRSRNRLMQWQPLAAAATVAGLAFVLVQLMPRHRDVAPSIQMEEPAPGTTTAEEKQAGTSAREGTEARAATGPSDSDAATDGTTAMHATEADRRQEVAPEMAPEMAKSATAAAPARERSQDNAAQLTAADWAGSIATQYASGDATGAADALRAFRAAYPDADNYLPDSLRNWARTVE